MTDSADEKRPPKAPAPDAAEELSSEQLLRGKKILIIRHGDESYRLIVTRNNRLILQK